jgi:PTS system cellobiose-specific IIA component
MTENEKRIFQIIGSSGDSKAKAFQALECVKNKDFAGARELLAAAKEADVEAHNAQTQILVEALNATDSDPESISLLMVHAQDHYMTSQLARDLIEELVDVFEAYSGN